MSSIYPRKKFHGSKIRSVEHGKLPDTSIETIDRDLNELKEHQLEWAQDVLLEERIDLLTETLKNIDLYKDDWIQGDILARHVPEGHPEALSSYLTGAATAALVSRRYIDALTELIKTRGSTTITNARQDDNRISVKSFPLNFKDQIFLAGWRGEIHLEKGTTLEELPSLEAKYYKDKDYKGGVALILVAGNVSSLAISDLYQKLIAEKKVVIIKVHPILEYMGSILTKVLGPFIKRGFIRIVMGGAIEGQHLTQHPLIDEIHLTGSDKTFEAIVFGAGEEGQKNKEMNRPITTKTISGELGNITPIIVVPGPWREKDFDYQADNIFSMLALYNGYTCSTPRILILPEFWEGSKVLVEKIEARMAAAPPPVNYYPGTDSTAQEAMACYPDMVKVGDLTDNQQPWMFVKGLNAEADEDAFTREFWAAFLAQTYIEAKDTEDYLRKAVDFANERLWGTLSACIIIDPKTEKELTQKGVFQKVIDDLHYGTVATNVSPGFAFALGTSPWGGYPGATYDNIQSGNTFVLNPFMLDKIEKSIIYAPFRISPRPLWFPDENPNLEATKALSDFLIRNKMSDFGRALFRILWH